MFDELKFSKNFDDPWFDIFKDVVMNVIPLNYVHNIKIIFKNKKAWLIKIKKQENIENELNEILNQYVKDIKNVEVDLNIKKIKKEAINFNKKFLK